MKVLSADFFPKPARFVMTGVMFSVSALAAQNYPPGAVQTPVYRQSGSAYTPAGPRSPAPAYPPGYQHGFGTPPASPTVKPGSTASKAPLHKTGGSQTLENKVARLERNDARQDQRLSSLERGHGSSSSSSATTGGQYVVRPGDTLWGIANRHSTSINAIKSTNRLNGETISVGQTLLIPGYGSATSAPATGQTATTGVHIVRPGDTFSQIAQANGIRLDDLARANPSVYPDKLLVGEKITLPGRAAASSPSPARPAAPDMGMPTASSRAHIVKKGESLGAIAKNYGIPTAELAAMNKLKNPNLIAPGQRLIVPGTSSPAFSAPAYPAQDPVAPAAPSAGQGLASTYVPAPKEAVAQAADSFAAPAPSAKPSSPVSNNRRAVVAYRLERGDDINTVANLFNTSPETIRELNKLSADRKLKEGDEVVVPSLGAVSLN